MAKATAAVVVRYLVNQWNSRLPRLADYLKEEFGYVARQPLRIKRLFICEQADGNVEADNIGHMYAAKWVVTAQGAEAVPLRYAFSEMFETHVNSDIYASPSYSFCYEDDKVLLSERYAGGLTQRRRGRVIDDGVNPVIEWTTLWKCILREVR